MRELIYTLDEHLMLKMVGEIVRCKDCTWYDEKGFVCELRPWARAVKAPEGYCDEGRKDAIDG